MYHIKQDKRSQTSASMLYEALMECIREKGYDKISVTELVARAGVGRSTFYRNFDEISDILYWKCDRQFAELLQDYDRIRSSAGNPLGLLEHVFSYWMERSEILETLLSINRIDIIYDCFSKNSVFVTEAMQRQYQLSEVECEYFIYIRIGVFVGAMHTWLKGGRKETAQQLSQILARNYSYSVSHDMLI